MTNVEIYVNTEESDDSILVSPSNFVKIDVDSDKFILTKESLIIRDEYEEPSDLELDKAAILIKQDTEVIVPALYLVDRSNSGHELQKIYNFNQNKRYTFCVKFDGSTLDIPVLQAWDNNKHNTTILHSLGNGNDSQSWIYAILTTAGLPGSSWVGSKIYGNTHLELSGSPLGSGTHYIYFNLRVVVPQNYPFENREEFKLAVRYKTN